MCCCRHAPCTLQRDLLRCNALQNAVQRAYNHVALGVLAALHRAASRVAHTLRRVPTWCTKLLRVAAAPACNVLRRVALNVPHQAATGGDAPAAACARRQRRCAGCAQARARARPFAVRLCLLVFASLLRAVLLSGCSFVERRAHPRHVARSLARSRSSSRTRVPPAETQRFTSRPRTSRPSARAFSSARVPTCH